MREFKRALVAGAQDWLAATGNYVHVKSSVGPVKVITEAGEEVTLIEGQGIRFSKSFKGFDVRNDHSVDQIFVLLVGDGEFQDQRVEVKSSPNSPVWVMSAGGPPQPVTTEGVAPIQVANNQAGPMVVRAMEGAALPVYVPSDFYALPVYQKPETPEFRVAPGETPFRVAGNMGAEPLWVGNHPGAGPFHVTVNPGDDPLQVAVSSGAGPLQVEPYQGEVEGGVRDDFTVNMSQVFVAPDDLTPHLIQGVVMVATELALGTRVTLWVRNQNSTVPADERAVIALLTEEVVESPAVSWTGKPRIATLRVDNVLLPPGHSLYLTFSASGAASNVSRAISVRGLRTLAQDHFESA